MDDPGRRPGTSYVTFELLAVVAIGYGGGERGGGGGVNDDVSVT